MNKIWKSGSTWRKLPKRVSPLLNVVQALITIAAVMLFLMLFKYRRAEAGTVQPRVRYTAYIDEKTHPLAKLSRELEPSEFLRDHPGYQAKIQHVYEHSQVKMELPRPKRTYALPVTEGFVKFPAATTERRADPVVVPPEFAPRRADIAGYCIIYDRFGRELSRWESGKRGALKNTLFKISGKGILLCCQLVDSSGDAELDKLILRKASELHLPAGLYSVIHPDTKE